MNGSGLGSEAGSLFVSVLNSQGCLLSILSLTCSLVYFVHFNFGSSVLRLFYLVFLCIFPLCCLVTNLVVANSLSSVVLQG